MDKMPVIQNACRACETDRHPCPSGEHGVTFVLAFACGSLFPRVQVDALIKGFCPKHRAQFDKLYIASAEKFSVPTSKETGDERSTS